MAFQLVRASDDDIAIWHTEQGHIYVFAVEPETRSLRCVTLRSAPGAEAPAENFADDALEFATGEARARRLLSAPPRRVVPNAPPRAARLGR